MEKNNKESWLEEGVILPTVGLYENVIRLLTPLVIEETNLEKGLDKLEGALAKVDK